VGNDTSFLHQAQRLIFPIGSAAVDFRRCPQELYAARPVAWIRTQQSESVDLLADRTMPLMVYLIWDYHPAFRPIGFSTLVSIGGQYSFRGGDGNRTPCEGVN
jgi:hypothetical protein